MHKTQKSGLLVCPSEKGKSPVSSYRLASQISLTNPCLVRQVPAELHQLSPHNLFSCRAADALQNACLLPYYTRPHGRILRGEEVAPHSPQAACQNLSWLMATSPSLSPWPTFMVASSYSPRGSHLTTDLMVDKIPFSFRLPLF